MTKGRKPSSIITGTKPVLDPRKPPARLSRDAKLEWRRVIPSITQRRILDIADVGLLEAYCLSIGRAWEIERVIQRDGFDPALDRAQSKAIATARQLAALFGLTPADRSRPTIRDGADDDDGDLFGDD
jgi:P27 family predicted phage terminase small subunit